MGHQKHHKALIQLLSALGWTYQQGDTTTAIHTGRTNFFEGIQREALRHQLNRLNEQALKTIRASAPLHINAALDAITFINSPDLLLSNELTTALLTHGYQTKPLHDQQTHHIPFTLQYIDWNTPEKNHFQAIEQYRVLPSAQRVHQAQPVDASHSIADLILFINGIPIVAVAYANTNDTADLKVAVETLRMLANRRYDSGESRTPEGAAELYQSLQLFCAIGPQRGWYGFLDPGMDLDTSCALLHPLELTHKPETKVAGQPSITDCVLFDNYYLLKMLQSFATARYNKVGAVSAASILSELAVALPVSTH